MPLHQRVQFILENLEGLEVLDKKEMAALWTFFDNGCSIARERKRLQERVEQLETALAKQEWV